VAFLDHGRLLPKVVVFPQCAHFAIFQFLSKTMRIRKICLTNPLRYAEVKQTGEDAWRLAAQYYHKP
jgi:hypothetical protein